MSDGDSSETEEDSSPEEDQGERADQSKNITAKRDHWAANVLKEMSADTEEFVKKDNILETYKSKETPINDSLNYDISKANPMVAKSMKKRRGKLPENATQVLKKWLFDHWYHPYPTGKPMQLFIPIRNRRREGCSLSTNFTFSKSN